MKGVFIYDLFGAAAEIVLVHYAIIMASSVTQISSAPLNSPSSPPSAEASESRRRADRYGVTAAYYQPQPHAVTRPEGDTDRKGEADQERGIGAQHGITECTQSVS